MFATKLLQFAKTLSQTFRPPFLIIMPRWHGVSYIRTFSMYSSSSLRRMSMKLFNSGCVKASHCIVLYVLSRRISLLFLFDTLASRDITSGLSSSNSLRPDTIRNNRFSTPVLPVILCDIYSGQEREIARKKCSWGKKRCPFLRGVLISGVSLERGSGSTVHIVVKRCFTKNGVLV